MARPCLFLLQSLQYSEYASHLLRSSRSCPAHRFSDGVSHCHSLLHGFTDGDRSNRPFGKSEPAYTRRIFGWLVLRYGDTLENIRLSTSWRDCCSRIDVRNSVRLFVLFTTSTQRRNGPRLYGWRRPYFWNQSLVAREFDEADRMRLRSVFGRKRS